MISDRYILKPYPNDIERLLDFSEHMAACYGFNAKELLLIRLITEEMIASIRSGLLLTPGELWFSTDDDMFGITASVRTDVLGMPAEQRKKLLELASPSKKSGIFGFVQEFIDHIAASDDTVSLQGFVNMRYGETGVSYPPGAWKIDGKSITAAALETEEPGSGQDIEVSLLRGFADDIRVTGRAKTLEISVLKKIHFNFLMDCISDGGK